ncbi:glycosyltransferase family 4 protein [Bacteroidota bacterium]
MKIAINTRLLISNKLDGIGWFIYETLKRITPNHPEIEFYFFFDRPYSEEFIFSDNIWPVVIHPQARHPVLFYWWFEKQVPKYLEKFNIDFFLSPDGYLSLSTNVPSMAVIHDINFFHRPKDLPLLVRKYYQYYFPRFAKKAKKIATVSQYSKIDISKNYNVEQEKIDVVYNGANEIFTPIDELEKITVKEKYTNGEDYFIFVGSLHPRKNLKRLLGAFELFKKETNSRMKLVIVGEKMFKTNEMKSYYNKMHYKNDVIWTGRLSPENLKRMLGSALALTFVPVFEGFGIPILEAMYCDTPVISANVTSMPEVTSDAALLVDPYSIEEIKNAMLKIVKDEKLRQELINKARIQRKKYTWDKTALSLWNSIEDCLADLNSKES